MTTKYVLEGVQFFAFTKMKDTFEVSIELTETSYRNDSRNNFDYVKRLCQYCEEHDSVL